MLEIECLGSYRLPGRAPRMGSMPSTISPAGGAARDHVGQCHETKGGHQRWGEMNALPIDKLKHQRQSYGDNHRNEDPAQPLEESLGALDPPKIHRSLPKRSSARMTIPTPLDRPNQDGDERLEQKAHVARPSDHLMHVFGQLAHFVLTASTRRASPRATFARANDDFTACARQKVPRSSSSAIGP
jgi:hypothetical protein